MVATYIKINFVQVFLTTKCNRIFGDLFHVISNLLLFPRERTAYFQNLISHAIFFLQHNFSIVKC